MKYFLIFIPGTNGQDDAVNEKRMEDDLDNPEAKRTKVNDSEISEDMDQS